LLVGRLIVLFRHHLISYLRKGREAYLDLSPFSTSSSDALQIDPLCQGLDKACFLVIPSFVIAANVCEHIHALEIIGILVWTGSHGLGRMDWVAWTDSLTMESIADIQKLTGGR